MHKYSIMLLGVGLLVLSGCGGDKNDTGVAQNPCVSSLPNTIEKSCEPHTIADHVQMTETWKMPVMCGINDWGCTPETRAKCVAKLIVCRM